MTTPCHLDPDYLFDSRVEKALEEEYLQAYKQAEESVRSVMTAINGEYTYQQMVNQYLIGYLDCQRNRKKT